MDKADEEGADGAGTTDTVAAKVIPYQPNGSIVKQGDNPYCGIACTAMVISDKTGKSVDLTETLGKFENTVRATGVNGAEIIRLYNIFLFPSRIGIAS